MKYNIPLIFPWVFKDVIDHLLTPSSYNIAELHYTMLAMIMLFLFWYELATGAGFYCNPSFLYYVKQVFQIPAHENQQVSPSKDGRDIRKRSRKTLWYFHHTILYTGEGRRKTFFLG
ncbi:MAG: hypothetical protein ACUBOA_06160 [Candidatus Loosdrechtia sp.]